MADTQLDIILNAIDKATKSLRQTANSLSHLEAVQRKYGQTAQVATQAVVTQIQTTQSLGTSVRDMGQKFQSAGQSLALGFTVPLVATAAVLTSFDQSASRLQVGEAFIRTANQFKIGSTALITAIDEASGSTISRLDLMAAASRAMVLGVGEDVEDFRRLMEIARDRARVFGVSTTQAFNDLTLGIGRQSRLILDNLGIIVRVEDANEEYARSLGKNVNQLSLQEKRTAFLNAVLDQTEKTIDRNALSVRTLSEEYQKQRAEVDNLIETFEVGVLPIVSKVLALFNALPATAKLTAIGIVAVGLVAGPLLSAFGALIKVGGSMLLVFPRIALILKILATAQSASAAAAMIAAVSHSQEAAAFTITTASAQRVAAALSLVSAAQASVAATAVGASAAQAGFFASMRGMLGSVFLMSKGLLIIGAVVSTGLGIVGLTKSLVEGKHAADSFRDAVNTAFGGLLKKVPGIGALVKTDADLAKAELERYEKIIQDASNRVSGAVNEFNTRIATMGQLAQGPALQRLTLEAVVEKVKSLTPELGVEFETWKAFFAGIAQSVPADLMEPIIEELDKLAAQDNVIADFANAARSAWDTYISAINDVRSETGMTVEAIKDLSAALQEQFAIGSAIAGLISTVSGLVTREDLAFQKLDTQLKIQIIDRELLTGSYKKQIDISDAEITAIERERDALDLQIRQIDIAIRERELLKKALVPKELYAEIAAIEASIEANEHNAAAIDLEIRAIEKRARELEKANRPLEQRIRVIDREIDAIERQARVLERANRPLERRITLLDIERRRIELASRPARRELERLQEIPGLSLDVIRAQQKIVDGYDDQIATLTDANDALELEILQRQLQIDMIRDGIDLLQDQKDALQDEIDVRRDQADAIRDAADDLRDETQDIDDQIASLQYLIQERKNFIATLVPPEIDEEIEKLKDQREELELSRDRVELLIQAAKDLSQTRLTSDPELIRLQNMSEELRLIHERANLIRQLGAMELALNIAGPGVKSLRDLMIIMGAMAKGFSLADVSNWLAIHQKFSNFLDPYAAFAKAHNIPIPALQKGGVVTRPTFSMLGERGAEAIIPLNRLSGFLNPPRNEINLILEGPIFGDEVALEMLAQKVHNRIKRKLR